MSPSQVFQGTNSSTIASLTEEYSRNRDMIENKVKTSDSPFTSLSINSLWMS